MLDGLRFHSLIAHFLPLSLSVSIFSQDEARKKAASTYLVESADMPPPRYQKDGTLPALYPNNMGKSSKDLTLQIPLSVCLFLSLVA